MLRENIHVAIKSTERKCEMNKLTKIITAALLAVSCLLSFAACGDPNTGTDRHGNVTDGINDRGDIGGTADVDKDRDKDTDKDTGRDSSGRSDDSGSVIGGPDDGRRGTLTR